MKRRLPVVGLLLALSAHLVFGQGLPSHSTSSFQNLPARFSFFDDTDTAIFHDSMEGNIYVSLDEGKSWKMADGIPGGKASMFYEHPVDNRYAFVLTGGKTHYRTEDRGKTWRSFDLPLEPALVSQPLSFHSDPKKYGYIMYQGMNCVKQGWGRKCHDETYYTKEAFSDEPKLLRTDTSRCQFAHSTPDFRHEAHEDLIYCTGYDSSSSSNRHDLSSSRLFSSTDFFKTERVEDLGIGKNAKGIIAFAIVSKFGVVALKDLSHPNGDLHLYVTIDTKTWARAHFPHASSARLREDAYTMLESTTHSLAVDVVLKDLSPMGTLFVSNSNGTYFVQSLKDTNRNVFGYVDYERIYGVEGIGIANIVSNAQEVEARRLAKKLKSLITFDDGSNWSPITPPKEDTEGKKTSCDTSDSENCSLHFHSVTTPHNYGRVFSSPAPGLAIGVGSIGKKLEDYKDSDTFLSTDAGVSWHMITKGAYKHQFGDQGSILVIVDDEGMTDHVKYSLDLGKTWSTYSFGVLIRARGLTTLPDSTSQKFLLLGQVGKDNRKEFGRVVVIHLDFTQTRGRQCGDGDFENWYARQQKSECLMGHKQWYKRRKPDANCYVGQKFKDPVVHEDNCKCTDLDYECDYNFVRNGDTCEPVGPEPIPAGVCSRPEQTYMGSSGWRKIPGNTCEGGLKKDERVEKKCSQAQPPEGEIIHQTFEFKNQIVQHAYFNNSRTILVRLADLSVWQSSNEGYSWTEPVPGGKFLAFYHHKYTNDRAFLITESEMFYYTTDTGRHWYSAKVPTPPNTFGAMFLHFHPTSDFLIWTGNRDCGAANSPNCHAEAQFSRDNGRKWTFVESYVRNCAFAKDHSIDADPTEIICESFKEKSGNQRFFSRSNLMELVVGSNYFQKRRTMFNAVVGFAKFSEYLVVAEFLPEKRSLALQVSLDGVHFATGQFPPSMHPETHAYTILESSTDSLFLHMTMSEPPAPYWGNLLKSNSNGTYFGIALNHVNRNDRGYVDFEKMIGLDGIALVNIVSNPEESMITNKKSLQTRITHNDGGTWTPLNPPSVDSQGNKYECQGTKCQLNIHGYTERRDPRATYSSPSIKGLLMAVGNVGEKLAPYTDSDTFLSRDAGFSWEEVHKDAHMWEFGDSGSILVMVNDEQPTKFVLFSTDEGLNWREYQFSDRPMRIRAIVTVPMDTSRKFILFGDYPKSIGSTSVHVDFSALTLRQCTISIENPGKDDFELWSPSEGRPERCLFGRQTLYHRRVRNATCIVGDQEKIADRFVQNCACTKDDFECEFNHVKDGNDNCVLVPGTQPLPNDETCHGGEESWYERTAYRKIPYSSCEDGYRPDRGIAHVCPGFSSKGFLFWSFMLLLPFSFTGLVVYYYYRRSGLARGTIRLPTDSRTLYDDSGVLATIASVPWFVIGVAGIAYEWVASRMDSYVFRSRSGYRNVPLDEDAQILRFEDEEQ